MVSDSVHFCIANVSRNERMARAFNNPGLKAKYAESANHWRRLAEQIGNIEDGKHQGSIADMARALFPKRDNPADHQQEQEQALALGTDQKQETRPESDQIVDARLDPQTGQWECPAP
jgi:hypothetical protein